MSSIVINDNQKLYQTQTNIQFINKHTLFPLILVPTQTKMLNSQLQQAPLEGKQLFERVLISTPLQQKHYDNVTFANVEQNLMKQIEKLIQSSFYTHFDVYFSAENLSNRSYIEEKYKREEEILKLQIQQTKKKIFQLSRANDQQQFDKLMKNYLQNMKIINDRIQDVDHVDFIPVIHVEAKKKRPLYGHLMQQFNRKGAGVLKVKLGYRSPFLELDCFELNLETPLSTIKRKYFNLDLTWKNTHDNYGNTFVKLSHGNESTYKDIDEKSYSLNFGVDRPQDNLRIEWENKFRNPSIHQKFDQFIKKDYHLPSFKSSFKLTKVLYDSIQFNDVNMGTYMQTKAQLTLPFLSQAQFGKMEFNYRKFYDAIVLKKYFGSDLMKKMLSGSSFETNLRWNIIKCFNKNYLSDVNENLDIRGFESPKNPVQTFSNLKLSAKWNIHNFPLILQAKLTPFIYGQSGFSLLDMTTQNTLTPIKATQLYTASSMGMGVAFYVNKFAQIEVLYKLFGYQNMNRLQQAGFQIRIGIFD